MDKKGDYKYGIVLSLILGLIVLGLSLFFIFNELFTSEDTDRQICRQSVQLRATLPDCPGDACSFKDDFPLKCKTMVKTIEKEDVEEKNGEGAKRIIAETMAECWALYGKGDSNSFPAEYYKSSTCVPCARIHLTEEAKEFMRNNKSVNISIRDSLDLPTGDGYTYYNFLMNSGDKFSAFNFGNGFPFDLEGDNFRVIELTLTSGLLEKRVLVNKANLASYDAIMESAHVSLPKIFNHTKGDLLINYGIVTVDEDEFGDYIPYLFYFQAGQDPSPFAETKNRFVFSLLGEIVGLVEGAWGDVTAVAEFISTWDYEAENKYGDSRVTFCRNWEGIPA